MPIPVNSTGPLSGPRSDPSRPKATDIHDAAQQFEALLLGELLKATHSESSGWLGDSEDAAGQQAIALAEEHLAKALASQGGLGLAKRIEEQLSSLRTENHR